MSSRDLKVAIKDIISLFNMDKPKFAKYFVEARKNAGWSLDKCAEEFQTDRKTIAIWQSYAQPTMPQGSNMLKAMGLIICMSDSFQEEVLRKVVDTLKEIDQMKSGRSDT